MVEWAQSASLSGKSVRCSRPRSHARARTLSTPQSRHTLAPSCPAISWFDLTVVVDDTWRVALCHLSRTHTWVLNPTDLFVPLISAQTKYKEPKMMYAKETYFPFINYTDKRDFKIKDKWVLNMNNFTVKT